MPEPKELILFYQPVLSMEAAGAAGVFARLKIAVRPVTPDELGQPVGFLAGLPGSAAVSASSTAPRVGECVMVLCGISGPRLDKLLQSLREANVPRSVLKAVLTPTNAAWTFAALSAELTRERQATGDV